MTQASYPVARLRHSLQTIGLDGWYIGREDMFQGEEVPPSEERLAFVSGFTGSAPSCSPIRSFTSRSM